MVPLSRTSCTLSRKGAAERSGAAERAVEPSKGRAMRGRKRGDTEDEERGRRERRVPCGPSKEASREESSGLRRRGLFVPRRDAFGASYLRVTPCNRAPASVFSFLLSFLYGLFRFLGASLSLSRSRTVITLFVDLSAPREGEKEKESQASPLHARSAFEFEAKVWSARRSAAA